MELLRVKRNYQITIPASLRKQINVGVGDYLEADLQNGALVIRPVKVVRSDQNQREEALQALNEIWEKMDGADSREVEELVEEAVRKTRERATEAEQ